MSNGEHEIRTPKGLRIGNRSVVDSRSYKVGIVMEETEIEDYFADYFAKLSHTLARCGNEWYNHNKVYAGGRHGCFV